ncbi:polysialyltransferase family glycosyltransferase [Gallaecimonas xiamenensis]|uniref:Uncharacterized protein n=1 Tax=Gallaecimonas xiamenensis 3-C-1 TaxID=745411 RepID=K2JLR7_9GAMM|nr:polysialyltransferase family glycosyltransferase [Gallaecimonas xiamenensis]EKE75362.1 hypothetical protein B3C1_06789 [Gallaecimonas xiamenensis 3-C-1]
MTMKKKCNRSISFYDVNLLNHKNYIGDIILEFFNNDYSVTLFYDEFHVEAFNFFSKYKIEMVKNGIFSRSRIKKKLINSGAQVLIVNAQRLSDSAFVTVARSLGIKTGMIQHGMYIPFMKRERFFLFKKAIKTLRYLAYSFIIARTLGKDFGNVFRSFFGTFVKGAVYKDAVHFHKEVNTDFVLVYGPYWKQYHSDNFGYDEFQMYDIGYHELSKIDMIKGSPIEQDTVCYIAQTLVEDGRLPKEMQIEFLEQLERLDTVQVVIKLHPRSDKSMYEGRGFRLHEDANLPHCPLYIGHYSSLLALAGSISGMVLYEFPGHDIPDYFSSHAIVVKNVKDVSKTISNSLKLPSCITGSNFDDVFSFGYTPQLAFKIIHAAKD